MKIGYIIIAHKDPELLKRLIDTLDSPNVFFFVYIDKKTKENFSFTKYIKNMYVLNDLEIFWGGFSFIEATISLIKIASELFDFDYLILLSGSDYPVRSNEYINKFLKAHRGKEFINISPMPMHNKTLDRIEYYYLETPYNLALTSIFKRAFNRLIRLLKIKRDFPKEYSHYILYGGSAWWGFSKEAIIYINNFLKNNKKFVDFYRNTLIPDELFFQTIIGNSPFFKNIVPSLTYTSWQKNSAHPSFITSNHLKILKKNAIRTSYGISSNILFARKFSPDSKLLQDKIDLILRI